MGNLSPRAEQKFKQMQQKLAERYGVQSVSKTFSVNPTMEQTLHDKIAEEIDFLQRINVIGVRDKVGQKIFGGLTGSITKRTDTIANDRQPMHNLGLEDTDYLLTKTESDVSISYDLIDTWSKFPDFAARFLRYVRRQMALDRIKVGWHGTTIAAETDLATYPMLDDVNIGWLQHIRNDASSQMLTQGSTVNQIRLGATGDFKTLDALVQDVKQGIHTAHRHGGDLIAIVGEDLLAWDEAKLYSDHGHLPSEKSGIKQALKSYGGLPTMTVPFFPATGLTVTSLDNLSIYWQEGSSRRKVEDNPKRDRIEDYNSRNEGYVVEDFNKIAAIEAGNVVFV